MIEALIGALVALIPAMLALLKAFGDLAQLRQQVKAAAKNSDLDGAMVLIGCLQADNDRLRTTLAATEKRLAEMRDEFEADLASLRATYEKRVAELQAKIAEQDAEISRLRAIMRECGIDPQMPVAARSARRARQKAGDDAPTGYGNRCGFSH